MNVLTIVEDWLRQNNFDGLVEPNCECACKVDYLAPCGELGQRCIPGHLAPCPPECGEGCEWHIVGTQLDAIRTLTSEWLAAANLKEVDLARIVAICEEAKQ